MDIKALFQENLKDVKSYWILTSWISNFFHPRKYEFEKITFDSSEPSLSALIIKFREINNHEGTDKDTTHSYVGMYEKIFSSFRNRTCTVLEIGIYNGAFLTILADYFKDGQIFGIDINLENLRFGQNEPRIHIYEMNGTDPKAVEKLGIEYFDLIIEDGSHIPDEQIATFQIFAPLISPGGLYIIEDINSFALRALRPRLEQIAIAHKMTFEIIDLRFIKGRYDDICMIATKK